MPVRELVGGPPPRAVLLDLDGTVADTQEMIYQCFDATLREHLGTGGCRTLLARCTGLPLGEIFTAILEERGSPQGLAATLVESYRTRMLTMDADVRAYPAISPVLEALRKSGVRLGLVTSKHSMLALRHLRLIELEGLFEVVITGDQVRRLKPDPEPFLTALRRMGVPPGEALGVGDSIHDIAAARGAGMRAAAATWGTLHPEALLEAGPDVVLEHPQDLLAVVLPGERVLGREEGPALPAV